MRMVIAAAAAVGLSFAAGAQASGGEDAKLIEQEWSWQGVFGRYDHAQLRRGLQVYREVCATCHSMTLVRYRNLMEIGVPEQNARAYAAEFEYDGGFNDDGDPVTRPGTLADPLKAPFDNEKAARAANGGALPPDLSLMAKARLHGPDYIFTLLTSYGDEMPEDVQLADGMNWNPAFPGGQIAMAQMIDDGAVEYEDGAANDAKSIARDVTAFLNWTAEPELEERKSLGVRVMLFLFVFTVLFYTLKRQIWKRVKH